MRIITQEIRIIDYEQGQVFTREIMPEFGEYIQQLISYMIELIKNARCLCFIG